MIRDNTMQMSLKRMDHGLSDCTTLKIKHFYIIIRFYNKFGTTNSPNKCLLVAQIYHELHSHKKFDAGGAQRSRDQNDVTES